MRSLLLQVTKNSHLARPFAGGRGPSRCLRGRMSANPPLPVWVQRQNVKGGSGGLASIATNYSTSTRKYFAAATERSSSESCALKGAELPTPMFRKECARRVSDRMLQRLTYGGQCPAKRQSRFPLDRCCRCQATANLARKCTSKKRPQATGFGPGSFPLELFPVMPVAGGAILLRQGETRTKVTTVTRSQGDCGRAPRTQLALSSVVGCTWQLECVTTRMDRYEY